MRLYATHIDLLYRIALAEHYTSPADLPRYDVRIVANHLVSGGYADRPGGDGRLALTDRGRAALQRRLAGPRLDQLRRVQAARQRARSHAS